MRGQSSADNKHLSLFKEFFNSVNSFPTLKNILKKLIEQNTPKNTTEYIIPLTPIISESSLSWTPTSAVYDYHIYWQKYLWYSNFVEKIKTWPFNHPINMWFHTHLHFQAIHTHHEISAPRTENLLGEKLKPQQVQMIT